MILEVVTELPDHVELSEHLRERAKFYIMVLSFGRGYYIPATRDVRLFFGLTSSGQWTNKPPTARQWKNRRFTDAIRDIVSALYLQVRDVELAEIENNVTTALLKRMAEVMSPTVRRAINKETPPLLNDTKRADVQPV